MKLKNLIIKGLAALSIAVALVTIATVPAKADYYDCFAGNHAWKFDFTKTPATCEKPGCNIYYCVTCLKGIERWDIPMLGHTPDSGHVIVSPTATADGFLVYRCKNCGMYMGDQVIKSIGVDLPQSVTTPSPSVLEPFVKNPLAAVPMYFDTNMLAVCYIPYHSIVTVNGVGVNVDAVGAQPLAPFLQAPGKYVITVTPNTNPIHAAQNVKTFTVTVPKKAGQPVTVK